MKEYANYIKDDMVAELTDMDRSMLLSIDIIPIPMDEAIREVENRRLGVETNITNWQRRQNNNNNFSAVIPYDLEQQRKESKEFLDDLTTRDQRMFVCVITMVHTAKTLEQLNLPLGSRDHIGAGAPPHLHDALAGKQLHRFAHRAAAHAELFAQFKRCV